MGQPPLPPRPALVPHCPSAPSSPAACPSQHAPWTPCCQVLAATPVLCSWNCQPFSPRRLCPYFKLAAEVESWIEWCSQKRDDGAFRLHCAHKSMHKPQHEFLRDSITVVSRLGTKYIVSALDTGMRRLEKRGKRPSHGPLGSRLQARVLCLRVWCILRVRAPGCPEFGAARVKQKRPASYPEASFQDEQGWIGETLFMSVVCFAVPQAAVGDA